MELSARLGWRLFYDAVKSQKSAKIRRTTAPKLASRRRRRRGVGFERAQIGGEDGLTVAEVVVAHTTECELHRRTADGRRLPPQKGAEVVALNRGKRLRIKQSSMKTTSVKRAPMQNS